MKRVTMLLMSQAMLQALKKNTKLAFFTVAMLFMAPSYVSAQTSSQWVASAPRYFGWNFDWDDNIMFMPTKIVVFEKGTGIEKEVSTADFALMRDKVGKEGTAWANYEYRYEPQDTGSFRYFRKGANGENYFLQDIKLAVETMSPDVWKGPSWDAFVAALSDPKSAAWTSIITARGHPPEHILEALEYLKTKGYFKYVPRLSMLKGVGGADNPSAQKVVEMRKMIAEIKAAAGPLEVKWGFSDDDFKNYSAARDLLSADVKEGKHEGVKIFLFFTGHNHPTETPKIEVINPDGSLRLARPDEVMEGITHLSRQVPLNLYKKNALLFKPYNECDGAYYSLAILRGAH